MIDKKGFFWIPQVPNTFHSFFGDLLQMKLNAVFAECSEKPTTHFVPSIDSSAFWDFCLSKRLGFFEFPLFKRCMSVNYLKIRTHLYIILFWTVISRRKLRYFEPSWNPIPFHLDRIKSSSYKMFVQTLPSEVHHCVRHCASKMNFSSACVVVYLNKFWVCDINFEKIFKYLK